MSLYVHTISTRKQMRVDYKKSYFEGALNRLPVGASANSLYRVMRQFGYHFELENGRYYVYTDYEWKMKRGFEKTISPLLKSILRGFQPPTT